MKAIKKSAMCLLLALVILCGTFPVNVFAAGTASEDILTTQDLSAYQSVLDRLNEEYGYSMSFATSLFTRNSTFESPTNLSLAEFEAELRRDIETDIATNNEALAAVAALGTDAEWEPVPYLGKSYELPVNMSYMSSQVVDTLYEDTISFQNDVLAETSNNTSSTYATSSTQTLTSIQPKQDPTGNIAFLMTSTIAIPSYWKYSAVDSFSYMVLGNGAKYIPTAASRSYIDSSRTVAVTFTCSYYNASGVLVNSNSSVYREFHATSDCITNWPNYTISKTVTNKTYNLIDDFDSSQNCAGYAWNYDSFVSMASLGITYTDLNSCSSLSSLRTLVKNKSESFMSSHGITASQISSYSSSINTSTQYRVVLRVGYYDANGDGEWNFSANPNSDSWDYHWWMQLGDGTWADKRGTFPSRIVPNSNIYSDPDSILWSTWWFGEVEYNDFYSSTPVYYKITG